MRTIKPIAAKFRMHRSKNKRSIDSSSFLLYNMKAGMHIQKQFFSIILIFISSSFGAYNKIKFSFYLFWLVGCKMQAHTYVHEHRGKGFVHEYSSGRPLVKETEVLQLRRTVENITEFDSELYI